MVVCVVVIRRAGSEFVRSIVFGALDGILTSFGIVASIYGSDMAANVVILLGFSNVIADGIAMGVGDALSAKAENDHVLAERRREAWEYDNYREGEIKEMIELYVSKGFSTEDASKVIRIMAQEKYKDFFIDHMMLQELGHEVPDADDSPAKAGLAMFISFILFGSVPLIPYIGFYAGKYHEPGAQFGICCAATVVALFTLGVMQVRGPV
jgi:VIT1/CCC1 family predicted Fe2+/Mn2+ transporter